MSQAEKCFKCGQIPDDILMLACNHDLCLSCASQVFANQKPSTRKEFVCDLCVVVTDLDASSIYELEKLNIQLSMNHTLQQSYANNMGNLRKINQPESQQVSVLSATQPIRQRTQPQQQTQDVRHYSQTKTDKENIKCSKSGYNSIIDPKTSSVTSLSHRNMTKEMSSTTLPSYSNSTNKSLCGDHPEEEVSYFCFDCQTKCICPECIIHGVHKTHEVKTTKKAYPIIKQIVEEIQDANLQTELVIEQQRAEIERRQNQKVVLIESLQQQIKHEFQILHQGLNMKEQELTRQLNEIPNFLKQYEEFLMQSDLTVSKLKMLEEKIQYQLEAKDEIPLLNFYAGISQQQMPQAYVLPEQQEFIVNHLEIFAILKEIRLNIEQITLNVSEDTSNSPYTNDQIKFKDSKVKLPVKHSQAEMQLLRSADNKKKYINLL